MTHNLYQNQKRWQCPWKTRQAFPSERTCKVIAVYTISNLQWCLSLLIFWQICHDIWFQYILQFHYWRWMGEKRNQICHYYDRHNVKIFYWCYIPPNIWGKGGIKFPQYSTDRHGCIPPLLPPSFPPLVRISVNFSAFANSTMTLGEGVVSPVLLILVRGL